ncbi:hypothetical protein [Undibacterium sp.]|jgi:hypothetical protein|uniref:hypothetical protein n=1 Tax=Undibacterium sp. TaxID=1914977 RepID=UPI002BADF258|nr:hypothetical protein [Undibacterium sp.]HTD03803.1 hypothetical protein [Undibacterium sp.]
MLISNIGSGYANNGGVSWYSSGAAIDGSRTAAAAEKTADFILAEDAGVVAALSSGTGSPSQTYTSTGLLDGIISTNAGTYSDPLATLQTDGSKAESVAQQAVNKQIVATLKSTAVAAGVYNGTGILQSLPLSRVSDLGSLLRNNPQLSYVQISNSYNQGIIESLNIIA